MMKVTKEDQEQRIRVASARSALWELIARFTTEHGALSEAEWLYVLNDTCQYFISRKMKFSKMSRKSHNIRLDED